MLCIDEEAFVEAGIDRVLTQYRESPKLLHMIRTYLRHLWQARQSICDLPSFFNLDTATGDQLTIIGKWMGFPRCHCVCDVQPSFGFPCEIELPGSRPIVGFCEGGLWLACGEDGVSEICITDDDVYRSLLIARSYQFQSRYGWDDQTAAIQAIFGRQARIMDSGHGQVVYAPFRALSDLELAILQVIPRALPLPPGVSSRWHFGTRPIFGFGEGWGGFCEPWETVQIIVNEDEAEIGSDTGEAFAVDYGFYLLADEGIPLTTEDGAALISGPLTKDADWLCRFDLKPYSC